MYRIRKEFKFEMAHQLSKAFSCACSDCIHGHSYDLELFFISNKLDETGMVIDFGQIKAVLGEYIDSWDHAIVMHKAMDPEYIAMLDKYIGEDREFAIEKVRLHETRTGWAEYESIEC